MRIRTIKPEFLSDEDLWDLEENTGIPGRIIDRTYIGLWMIADREGRFEWRPRVIGPQVLPFWEKGDISRVLDALTTRGFVVKYACGTHKTGEKAYGFIPKFKDHQWINNKEFHSILPEPPKSGTIPENASKITTTTREERVSHTPNSNYYKGKGKGKGNIKNIPSSEKGAEDVPQKKQSKPKTKTQKTDPGVKTLIDYFFDSLKKKVSPEASMNCGQAGLVFKSRLAALPETEIKQRIDNWFASTDFFIDQNKNKIGFFDQNFHILKRGPIHGKNNVGRRIDPKPIEENSAGKDLDSLAQDVDVS